ncbi:hypothetical protein ACEPAF_1828 [Sanghuangporus sanghuang]
MNDPRNEIVSVVKSFCLAKSVSEQRAAINRYFTPDAGFLHPLCSVHPGPGSRDEIAGIYEWYRDMSPDISLEVESFVYDESQATAYLNVVQSFHIFLSPFSARPARLLVKVTLRKNDEDGKYYITQQEDYYQPEEILHLMLPFLAPPLSCIKRLAGSICGINAVAFAYARGVARAGMEVLGLNRRQAKVNHVHQE